MSGDIVLSAALRNNLLSLQGTQRNIDTAQLRLATGLKVNSALDNPQNFFTAKSLNNRASDLGRLLDGISQSIRTIEQANTGVETLTSLLEQAETIAVEAQAEIRASEGFSRVRGNVDLSNVSDLQSLEGGAAIVEGASDTFDVTIVEADGTATTVNIDIDANYTADSIAADINGSAASDLLTARVTDAGFIEIQSDVENGLVRIEQGAANGLTALGFAALGLDTIAGTENDGAGATRQGGTSVAGNVIRSQVSGAATVGGLYEASATLAAADAGFLDGGGDDVNLGLTIDGTFTDLGQLLDTDTIQDVVDRINNAGLTGVEASFDTTTGQIEVEFDETIGQVEFQFTDNGASTVDFGFGTGASDGALAGNVSSELFTFDGVDPDVDQYEEDYNNVREQIDQLIEDSNYRGVNLLADDNLTSYFNEDRDNTLTTEGVDFSALGLGIVEGDFTNANNAQQAIDLVREAISDVRNFGQSIANDLAIIQTRRDFTEQTINTLKAGADDLTVADQNEEGANLLALQTRQQLGVTSLSLAAQSQQSVLRLF